MIYPRRPVFLSAAFKVLSLGVVLSLLVAITVYACSGLSEFHVTSHHISMDDEGLKRGPCADAKQDICKSVRNRMLSIQSSFSSVDVPRPILVCLPVILAVGIPTHNASSHGSIKWQTDFHSVFKLPLRLSTSVFRI